ncbi:MAG: GTPase Era [Acidobacteria bacterium]|nr:MAG: GTPase Era [Acidobacteriota bacterium]PYY20147.1 MAG: GTPase Era [Acidobacteriota bacterium]
MSFRSGFVSIIGRPNAGKSTLLNALVGEKVAIVTHKPQTTRHRIQGYVNVKGGKGRPPGQIVLIDTPGVHKPDSPLGSRMMREVNAALEERDAVLLIVDATQPFGRGDQFVLDLLEKVTAPMILLLNKIDVIEKPKLLEIIERYSKLRDFAEIIPISATKRKALDELIDAVIKRLPEGPRYFEKDQITDQPERALVAEMIRERVLIETGQEVPYAAAVKIERFEAGDKLTRIAAAIYCEREGQKAILIGKGGAMLKRIGTSARKQIERLVGTKVFLELFVKVRENWRSSEAALDELDWRNPAG